MNAIFSESGCRTSAELAMLPPQVWLWSMWDHLVQDQFPDKPNYGVVADNPHKFDLNW